MGVSRVARATALVTGASGGIGLELAREAAADGYDLVLVARSREPLEALAEELRGKHGAAARVIAKDLADPAAPAEIVAELERAGARVDVLVNNAGFGTWGRFAELDPEVELAMLRVNVVALVQLTRLFLPAMVSRGAGRVLNVASTAGFAPGPLMAVYYASKAFVLSFSEALGAELAGSGVTVTALCPGPTRTGFQAAAKMEGARLVSGLAPMHDAAWVARAGWRGAMRGTRVVVPGLLNKLSVHAPRFGPRRLVAAITHRLNARSS